MPTVTCTHWSRRCKSKATGMIRRLPHRSSQVSSIILVIIFCTLLFYINSSHKASKNSLDEPIPKVIFRTEDRNASIAHAVTEDPDQVTFISVKTSEKFLIDRVEVILKTWYNLARDAVYFFTDSDNRHYQAKTNGHMINTNCSASPQSEGFMLQNGRRTGHISFNALKRNGSATLTTIIMLMFQS